jgi:simple sugar transport system permease protein
MVNQATEVEVPERVAAPTPPGGAGWAQLGHGVRAVVQRREIAIILVAAGLFLYFWTSTTAFATVDNFVTLTQFLAPIAVIGAGEAILLTAGEVDLSAGTAFIFFPFVVYYLWANSGVALPLAIIIALVCAAAFGLVNGLITTLLDVPSFVTTLGTLFALFGIQQITSNGVQETISPAGAGGSVLGSYSWAEILWALLFVAVMFVMLHQSRFGAHVVATGGNLLGASEAGIPVKRVKTWCFILVSVVSAYIGIVDSIRITTLDPGNDGTQEMFYAIAAAVIGGTALSGGRGTIVGAAIGAVVLGILFDGLYIKGVSAYYFQLVLGTAILIAMAANVQLRRATLRRWRRLPR